MFWTTELVQIEQAYPDVVKWWNLQCYDGGGRNSPQDWADAIAKAAPGRQTHGGIAAGTGSDLTILTLMKSWRGDCPNAIEQLFSGFAKQSCVGGGFLWSRDLINDSQSPPERQRLRWSDPHLVRRTTSRPSSKA